MAGELAEIKGLHVCAGSKIAQCTNQKLAGIAFTSCCQQALPCKAFGVGVCKLMNVEGHGRLHDRRPLVLSTQFRAQATASMSAGATPIVAALPVEVAHVYTVEALIAADNGGIFALCATTLVPAWNDCLAQILTPVASVQFLGGRRGV